MPTYDTRTQIGNTLLELAKKKDISKITVKDIVTICGISRQTFYYYFQDIMDVMTYIIEDRLNETLEVFRKEQSIKQGIDFFVKNTFENEVVIRGILTSKRALEVIHIFAKAARVVSERIFDEYHSEIAIKRVDKDNYLDFVTNGVVGCFMETIIQKNRTQEELAKMVYEMSHGDLFLRIYK